MTILVDPEEHEIQALARLSGDLKGQRVLEIGCGDGRLTWRYANQAGQVVAIDPDPGKIARAQAQTPIELQGKIHFIAKGLEEFTRSEKAIQPFDQVFLSWSL